VRRLIGGGQPWHQEIQRYATLLEPDGFQGAIGRRAPVLLGLVAVAGAVWPLTAWARRGIAAGPARRLLLGFVLGLAALTLSPTKWTQHFGDLAGYGAAVLVLGLVAWSGRGPVRAGSGRALAVGWGMVFAASALVLAGRNLWPYASGWFDPLFSAAPPRLGGVTLASILLVVGTVAVTALLARSAWLRAGGAPDAVGPRVPTPAVGALVVLVAVVALQVGSLGAVAVQRTDSYTLASDAVATLRGQPCGLQRLLSVETDPAAGLLPPWTGGDLPGAGRPAASAPVDTGNGTLPGIAVAGDTSTGWFAVEAGPLPVVVVTVRGPARPGDGLFAEFALADGSVERTGLTIGDGTSEARLPVPAGAAAVRLVTEATPPGPQRPALASLPRVPRVTPMTELLPPGTVAILDWPVAFLFGCLTPAPLPPGRADLPRWRVAPPASDPSAGITYAPAFGGPFAGPRLLVTEHRMGTYLAGDPLRDAATLYRWVPVVPMAEPAPRVVDRTVAGWHADGRTRVPGLDPVG
ncbi:MAG: arabinosyltransferase, partial [Pseudonocardia sp.]|nr:arabinosyltransferase [Pseudonocardia sp.]